MSDTQPTQEQVELRDTLAHIFKRYRDSLNGPVPSDLLYLSDPDVDPRDVLLNEAMRTIEAHTAKQVNETLLEEFLNLDEWDAYDIKDELKIRIRELRATLTQQPNPNQEGHNER